MHRAATCVIPNFRANQFGGAANLTVSGDGGWCWRDIERQGGGVRGGSGFTVYTGGAVTRPAQHGQARVTLLPSGLLRVAYQPAAGYVGPDSFAYVAQPSGVTIVVTVDVGAPGAS